MAYINFQLRIRNSLETMKWILIETLKFWFFPHVKKIATRVSLNFHDAAVKKVKLTLPVFSLAKTSLKILSVSGNNLKS